nr:acyl-CoA reductase [Psychromonas sp. SA13A]
MSRGRTTSSIVATGYWLRKSHLLSIKSQYPTDELQAKGMVFHIAPGNVDTLFFYSMIISVLCGNQTLLRMSNDLNEDAQKLLKFINQFLSESSNIILLPSLMTVIQYKYNDQVTAEISACSTARVIWGSDQTIENISKFPLSTILQEESEVSSNNICFPDRYSVAIIQLDDETDIESASENLLRDIKPYFQQACSSPKVIYWLNTAQGLQDKFWKRVSQHLSAQEKLDVADLMSQLLFVQRLPLLLNTQKINKNKTLLKKYDVIQVVEVESLTLDSIKSHTGLWVLLSKQIKHLDEIKLFEHCQTVTMSGLDQSDCLSWKETTPQPMKRVVPAGQALAFSHVWDGVDLVKELTIKSF